MGFVKFFSLQLLPWTCFQLTTNRFSCGQIQPEPPSSPTAITIKVINANGSVNLYTRPVSASELMSQFPKHMLCRSDSFYIGQKIAALAESDSLQLGHNYFLLPAQFFQSALSFVSIAAFASDKTNGLLKKAMKCRPFEIQKSDSGFLRIKVTDEFIAELMEEEGNVVMENGDDEEEMIKKKKKRSRLCDTPQLTKEYKQLVGSMQWKPKLETIREITEQKKKRKFSSTFGMKKRKNKQLVLQQVQIRSENKQHSTIRIMPGAKACSSSSSRSSSSMKGKMKRIIIKSRK